MEKTKGSSAVVAILIIVVVLVVAWLAYSQGYFQAKDQDQDANGVEIQLGGSAN